MRKGTYTPDQTKARQWSELRSWNKINRPVSFSVWRYETQQPGHPTSNYIRKLQWGAFADKLPTSVYFRPGPIASTDPQEQAYNSVPVAPELAGNYEAKPWVVPETYPEGSPLSKLPPPMQNVAAMAERNRNFFSEPSWYEMAEGEVVTPFEVLELDLRRVGQWSKDGRHWRMMVTVVVGNGAGSAGLGVGEGRSYAQAKNDAIKQAFGNLVGLDKDMWTVSHPDYNNFYRTEVQVLPSNALMCSPMFADVMSAFGMRSISIQAKKRRHKKYKKIMTLMGILRNHRGPRVIAQQRGVTLASTKGPLFTYFEQVRRRRGMFELSPPGRDGFFTPNRVIDNRLPDHLKRRYFEGTADEEYGRIAESPTFRIDAGYERYGAQNLPYLSVRDEPSDMMQWLDTRPASTKYSGEPLPAWTKGRKTPEREEWLAHA